MKRSKKIVVALLVFTLLSLPFSFNISKNELKVAQTRTDLEGIKVLVYNGGGNLGSSRIALVNMFRWMNATVDTIGSIEIRSDSPIDCDILVYPGGATYNYGSLIGEEGQEKIRQFVSNGGSFFGICGGSVFGASVLDLVEGSFFPNGVEVSQGTYIMEMQVNKDSTGPDLSNEPDTYSTLYWSSMYYASADMEGIIPILSYPHNNEAAMIASNYESGTVFLCSPHPEYEENSNRDGISDFDHLDDPDSEWTLMLKVAIWLVEASPDVSQTTDQNSWIPIGIALAIVIPLAVGVLGVAIFLLKRRR
jgi:glutamine amidotransferase-like uncharacterized protein